MANRFWVGNGGSYADSAHWSLTSGGAGGQPKPTANDAVFFDANSFSLPNQVVTMDDLQTRAGSIVTDSCFGNPTLAYNDTSGSGFDTLEVSGTFFFDGSMGFIDNTGGGRLFLRGWASALYTLYSAVTVPGAGIFISPSFTSVGKYTLLGNLTLQGQFRCETSSRFDANGFNVTCNTIFLGGFGSPLLVDMGSGVWTADGGGMSLFSMNSGNLFTENTHLVFTGEFAQAAMIIGGDERTWASVTLTGLTEGFTLYHTGGSGTVNIGTLTIIENNMEAGLGVRFGDSDFNSFTWNIGTLTIIGEPGHNAQIYSTTTFGGSEQSDINADIIDLAYVTFEGINAGGAAAPWSGNRLADGGNNNNIEFGLVMVEFSETISLNALRQLIRRNADGGAELQLEESVTLFSEMKFNLPSLFANLSKGFIRGAKKLVGIKTGEIRVPGKGVNNSTGTLMGKTGERA